MDCIQGEDSESTCPNDELEVPRIGLSMRCNWYIRFSSNKNLWKPLQMHAPNQQHGSNVSADLNAMCRS
jgi:hypothetical protein